MPVSLWGLPRTYKNLQRLQVIVNVLLKHGFGQLIQQLRLHKILGAGGRFGLKRFRLESKPDLAAGTRLRMVMEELGPCFIKFGQILSSRPDLIPPEFVEEFKKLQEHVPSFPIEAVRAQVKRQLKASIETVFSQFENEPRGSASIAQVHWATLLTGEEVVVKVQRPGIAQLIATDLSILFTLAGLINRYIPELRGYDPLGIVQEFADSINRELDFRLEANNLERFQHNFRDDPGIYMPTVYWDYTTKQVLTMERIHGLSVVDPENLAQYGIDPHDLATRGGTLFLRMILEHGFFHADPHPGNFLVLPDGRIALLDFGLVGRLEPEQVDALADLLVALLARDYERLVEELRNSGYGIPDEVVKQFRGDLRDLIEPYYGRAIKHLDLGDILQRIMEVTLKHHIRIPADYMLLTRTIVIIEGVGRVLDPDIDLVSLATPMALTIINDRLNPRRIATQAYKTAREFNELFKKLPKQLGGILKRINSNELRIEVLHAGLEDLLSEIDRASNRIAFGLVITGLVVGSSIVMATEKGPILLGYPAFGIIGYGMAAVMGLWLLISIIRSGRL